MNPIVWPPSLAGSPAVAVLERALDGRRLPHSLLLHGDDHDLLLGVARAIADRALRGSDSQPAPFPPEAHPDCFQLRPTGKSRGIGAEATRQLIGRLQVSPAVSVRKVAIIHEADRMNMAAANIFLKTLEEPPRNSVILLLTTRPYALLPTIRSRVLHFRFPSAAAAIALTGWKEWLADYRAWLTRLAGPATEKTVVADHIVTLYGLVARFDTILATGTEEAWKIQKAALPAELEDDEQVAIEAGLSHGLRARLFASIEHATREHAVPLLQGPGAAETRVAFVAAMRRLEHDAGLLRVNLNESAVLESFLLASLRIWAGR